MTLPRYIMQHGSTEYRRVLVTGQDDNGAVNPTLYPVELAFVGYERTPLEADWQEADWVTSGSNKYARLLVGPEGGLDLAEGDWDVHVRIIAGAETPSMRAGILILN